MKDSIILNNVAASDGGALSILKQVLDEVRENIDAKRYYWYVFVSNSLVDEYNNDHIKIVKIKAKAWHKRIIWDTIGIQNWLRKNEIKPLLAISLMSVGFKFLNVKQLIYIHQPLPFGDYNNFKSFEWKAKFYKYWILKWMKWTISKNAFIVVQTKWMKKAVGELIQINESNIFTLKPKINKVPQMWIDKQKEKTGFSYQLFYPSIPRVSYKNYDLIFNALAEIQNRNEFLGNKLKLVLTCSANDKSKLIKHYLKLVQQHDISENIIWAGYLNEQQMYENYTLCDVVLFPSLLETFGLPLIEASVLGKKIFVQDKPFSRDVLMNYEGAVFLKNHTTKWADAISNIYNNQPEKFPPSAQLNGEWLEFIHLVKKIIG